jgi:hypothetical protein
MHPRNAGDFFFRPRMYPRNRRNFYFSTPHISPQQLCVSFLFPVNIPATKKLYMSAPPPADMTGSFVQSEMTPMLPQFSKFIIVILIQFIQQIVNIVSNFLNCLKLFLSF